MVRPVRLSTRRDGQPYNWKMATVAIVWVIGAAIASACAARALAMRGASNHLGELLWYAIGADVLVVVCILWASLEPAAVIQQRFVIITVGAIAGALSLWVFTEHVRPPLVKASQAPPEVLRSQMALFNYINSFVGNKNEAELQDLFDIHNILKYNIKLYGNGVAQNRFPPDLNAEPYFNNGQMRVDLTRVKPEKTPEGAPVVDMIPGRIGIINLSRKYVDSKAKLSSILSYDGLPVSIRDEVKKLDEIVERDVDLIIVTLDNEFEKDQQSFLHQEEPTSPYFDAINRTYTSKVTPLETQARVISDKIREYLGTDR
jgi:hypothetical protein